MPTQDSELLAFQAARKLLVTFSCVEGKAVESEAEKQRLQQALLLFAAHSDQQNLGICADDAAQGLIALADYLNALGYDVPETPTSLPLHAGPVYIKFSGDRRSFYCERYGGRDRGVLVACQSSHHEAANGTYGYLPLDLFSSKS